MIDKRKKYPFPDKSESLLNDAQEIEIPENDTVGGIYRLPGIHMPDTKETLTESEQEVLAEAIRGHLVGTGATRLFFRYPDGTGIGDQIVSMLRGTTKGVTLERYEDPKVRNPENAPAALFFNRIHVASPVERDMTSADGLVSYMEQYIAERPELGVSLARGGQIDSETQELILATNTNAFDGFSDYHPGNQTWTPEEFRESMADSNSHFLFKKDQEGRVEGYFNFATRVEALPWLNDKYYNSLDMSGEIGLFYPGIGSVNPEESLGVAHVLMTVMAEAAAEYGGRYSLFFQCTNRSQEYIVAMVESYLVDAGLKVEPEILTKLNYRSVHLEA